MRIIFEATKVLIFEVMAIILYVVNCLKMILLDFEIKVQIF